jgi:hypothetical protein
MVHTRTSENMKTTNAALKKTSVIRARCEGDLKAVVEETARILHLEEADIVRIATLQYCQKIRDAMGPRVPLLAA